MNSILNLPISAEMLNATFKGCWKIQARADVDKSGHHMYKVACVHCGSIAEFRHDKLKTGHTRACKCLKESNSGLEKGIKNEIQKELIAGLNSVVNPENVIERAFEDIGLQKEVQELREETKTLKIENRNTGIALREAEDNIRQLNETVKDLKAAIQIKDSELKIKEMLEKSRGAAFTKKMEELKIKEVTLNRELERFGIKQ